MSGYLNFKFLSPDRGLRPCGGVGYGSSAQACTVGVFDSGLGGLSVLRALHTALPGRLLHYVADSGYAPYGERSTEFVVERSRQIAGYLVHSGASVVVVACNTATAAAIGLLRQQWPQVQWVGIEPGIKPAVALYPQGRIGVMATPSLLHSDKFRRLLALHSGQAALVLQPCAGLAALIEQGDLNAPALLALIAQYCQPLKDVGVDAVVLGCTHYPFVAHHIQAALGAQVRLLDSADAVALQTLRLLSLSQPHRVNVPSVPGVHLQTTGDAALLENVAQQWLTFACAVSPIGFNTPDKQPPGLGANTCAHDP
jgi:glutamate racemase